MRRERITRTTLTFPYFNGTLELTGHFMCYSWKRNSNTQAAIFIIQSGILYCLWAYFSIYLNFVRNLFEYLMSCCSKKPTSICQCYGTIENSSNGRPFVQLSPCTCTLASANNADRSSCWKFFFLVKTSFGMPSILITVAPSP